MKRFLCLILICVFAFTACAETVLPESEEAESKAESKNESGAAVSESEPDVSCDAVNMGVSQELSNDQSDEAPSYEPLSVKRKDGKLVFSISSPLHDIALGRSYLSSIMKVDNSDGKVFGCLSELLNGRDALEGEPDCLFDYCIYVNKDGGDGCCIFFSLCISCGSVSVSDGGNAVGTVKLTDAEMTELISTLKSRVSEDYRIPFEAQYIRTDGYHEETSYPVITVIHSKAELDGYFEKYGKLYDFSHRENIYSDTRIGFVDAIAEYDDDYFKSRILVLVLLEEGSGSIRHRITKVGTDGEIGLETTIPESSTCDMAEWHIIIEINKCEEAESYRIIRS